MQHYNCEAGRPVYPTICWTAVTCYSGPPYIPYGLHTSKRTTAQENLSAKPGAMAATVNGAQGMSAGWGEGTKQADPQPVQAIR